MPLALCLYQPEIAPNVGAAIRIAACFGAELHIVEPCGFPWKAREIDRVALDYGALARPTRHATWEDFRTAQSGRLLLLTTKGAVPHSEMTYRDDDTLILGQESAGVPQAIHDAVDARVVIPLAEAARALNVSVAGAVVLAEARRQLGY